MVRKVSKNLTDNISSELLDRKNLTWKKQKKLVEKFLCSDKKVQQELLDIRRLQLGA